MRAKPKGKDADLQEGFQEALPGFYFVTIHIAKREIGKQLFRALHIFQRTTAQSSFNTTTQSKTYHTYSKKKKTTEDIKKKKVGILNTLYRWHVQAALMVNTERPCSAVTEVSDTQSFNSASSFYFNNDFRLSCKILLGTCFLFEKQRQ